MGNIYHANVKTTARVIKEIQESKESGIKLVKKYSINPKTVFYWKNTGRVTDKKSGPANPSSTVLSPLEEEIICKFRRVTRNTVYVFSAC